MSTEDQRAKRRAYYAANRERILANDRARYAANLEAERERDRAKRAKPEYREKRRLQWRRWVESDAGRDRERRRHAADPDRMRRFHEKWLKEHPEYELNRAHIKRLRERTGDVRPRDIKRLLASRTFCPLCRKKMRDVAESPRDLRKKTIDHIVPINIGGTHTWANLRVICLGCNLRRPKDGSDYLGQLGLWSAA